MNVRCVSLNFWDGVWLSDANKWMQILVSRCFGVFAELMKLRRALTVW